MNHMISMGILPYHIAKLSFTEEELNCSSSKRKSLILTNKEEDVKEED